MAQISWYYTFPYGRKYEIGLFHGDQDRHVVIYCEGEILVIDFSVIDSKDYSFFIENVLLKISISKEEDESFSYLLSDDTPEIKILPSKQSDKIVGRVVTWLVMAAFLILLIWIFSFG